jgi:hypothetical protein
LPQRARLFASLALAVVVTFSLGAYYGAPGSLLGYRLRYAKENWPGAAAFIRQQQADMVVVSPGYLNLALDRYPRGAVREISTLADSSAAPDLRDARRVALVTSHSGVAQELLRASLDASYTRIAEKVFPSQNSIRVIVYDTPPVPRSISTKVRTSSPQQMDP